MKKLLLCLLLLPVLGFSQIQTFRASKLGFCHVKDGQKMTDIEWHDCNPNIAIIIDYEKSNIFIDVKDKKLFKITKVYPPKYTTGYTLYKYDTKDLDGKDVIVTMTMIKSRAQYFELAFKYPDIFFVYQMKEYMMDK